MKIGVAREIKTHEYRVALTPAGARELMTLFFAEGVDPGDASPEADEELELVRWPVEEVGERLGEIEDAKTLAGLLLYLRLRPR